MPGAFEIIVGRMPNNLLSRLQAKQCCFRPVEIISDDDGSGTTFGCPAGKSGACDLRRDAIRKMQADSRGGPSDAQKPFEPHSERRKREKEENHERRRAAAEAQINSVQVRVCKRWESDGDCRHLHYLGFQPCMKAHPDEETRTPEIECCSSSARPRPKRCLLMEKCPYRGHNPAII